MTALQTDLAEWAIDPMENYFAVLVEDGRLEVMPELPRLVGHHGQMSGGFRAATLVLPRDREVIKDLLYRLEEQLPDVDDGQTQLLTLGAQRLALKIRRVAFGYISAGE